MKMAQTCKEKYASFTLQMSHRQSLTTPCVAEGTGKQAVQKVV